MTQPVTQSPRTQPQPTSTKTNNYWEPRSSRRVRTQTKLYDPSVNNLQPLPFETIRRQADNSSGWLLKPTSYYAPFFTNQDLIKPYCFSSSAKNNPDIYSFDQCLKSPEPERTEWMESMLKEVRELEAHGTWQEVDIEEAERAGQKVVPSLWTMRVKRNPAGEATKRKSRLCLRGDLEDGDFKTASPVVAWPTIRVFLIVTLTLGWPTISCDFSNAFVQANMDRLLFMQIPRGFRPHKPGRRCLKMIKSIYGGRAAPLLWVKFLHDKMRKIGLTQSEHDSCLWHGKDLIVIQYCDDLGIGSKTPEIANELVKSFRKHGLELTVESSFSEYLGIKFERDDKKGTITMTQPGLIKKILETTDMMDAKPQFVPAKAEGLGKDPDGEEWKETWQASSINGMLLYLATNTRPDIAYAVSQTARFNHHPKQSHAVAIKKIVRYLKATSTKGMVIKLTNSLQLNVYPDASFCGLYNQDPPQDSSSAKSRMGHITFLGPCPLSWKSKLTPHTCLSTMESEYCALSYCLREFIPIRRMVLEVADKLGLSVNLKKTITTTIHEDNDACRLLAVNRHLTSRTKYLHTKLHHFWEFLEEHEQESHKSSPESAASDSTQEFEATVDPETQKITKSPVRVVRCDTKKQLADYFTKGLTRELFEKNRFGVQGW